MSGPSLFNYAQVLSADGTTSTPRATSQIPNRLGISSANVMLETYAGYSSNGDLLDISGSGRDLADSGTTPLIVNSSLLGVDGNPLLAFSYDGISGCHSIAHSAWMNIFDQDFAISTVVKSPESNPVAVQYFYSHGSYQDDGLMLGMSTGGVYTAYLSKAGTFVTISAPATSNADGLYHNITLVRSNGFVVMYLDGLPGETVDASAGYGLDQSRTLTIGCRSSMAAFWSGSVLYTRLQNNSMSYSKVRKEFSIWQSIASSVGGTIGGASLSSPMFIRYPAMPLSTTYADRVVGKNSLAQLGANFPATTNDKGILIEGSIFNLAPFSESFDNAAYTKTSGSVVADNVIAPNGRLTAETWVEGAVGDGDTAHSINLAADPTIVASATNHQNWYIKYVSGGREWVYLRNVDANKNAWFNFRYGYWGTVSANVITQHSAGVDDWYRITAGCTSATTTDTWKIGLASGDNALTYTGDARTAAHIWGHNIGTGLFATTYHPRLTAAVTYRAEDFLVYLPWKVSHNWIQKINATPTLLFLGSESVTGTTVVPTRGAYSFTRVGRPLSGESIEQGPYHEFNGFNTGDYLSLPDISGGSNFDPAGSFSVVAVFTPGHIYGGNEVFASKWIAAGNQRGWQFYRNGKNVSISRSTDGIGSATATCTDCLERGKPTVIIASYHTTNGLSIIVGPSLGNGQAATGVVWNSSADFNYGMLGGVASFLHGKLHGLAYYDGYVLSGSELQYVPENFIQDGIFPVTMDGTTSKTKVVIEFEVKAQYKDVNNIGTNVKRGLVSIAGMYGLSHATKNRIDIYAKNQYVYGSFWAGNDGSYTERYMRFTVTDADKWHKYKYVLDLINLSKSSFTRDGVVSTDTSGMVNTYEIRFTDAIGRIGQNGADIPNAHAEFRNIKMLAQ